MTLFFLSFLKGSSSSGSLSSESFLFKSFYLSLSLSPFFFFFFLPKSILKTSGFSSSSLLSSYQSYFLSFLDFLLNGLPKGFYFGYLIPILGFLSLSSSSSSSSISSSKIMLSSVFFFFIWGGFSNYFEGPILGLYYSYFYANGLPNGFFSIFS